MSALFANTSLTERQLHYVWALAIGGINPRDPFARFIAPLASSIHFTQLLVPEELKNAARINY